MGIYLIEDSKADALYVSDALVAFGYPRPAHIAREADFLAALDTAEWRGGASTLIILDLFLPGRDGIEMLRDLQHHDVAVPIILVSGNDEQYLKMAKELGTSWGLNILDALQKPVDMTRVIAYLRQSDISPA